MKLYIVTANYSKFEQFEQYNVGISSTHEEAKLIKIENILKEIRYVDESEKKEIIEQIIELIRNKKYDEAISSWEEWFDMYFSVGKIFLRNIKHEDIENTIKEMDIKEIIE